MRSTIANKEASRSSQTATKSSKKFMKMDLLWLAYLYMKTCIATVRESTIIQLAISSEATPLEQLAGGMTKRASCFGSARTSGHLSGDKMALDTLKPVMLELTHGH